MAGEDYKSEGGKVYPIKMVTASFIEFLERLATLDTHLSNLKPYFSYLDQLYHKIVKSKLAVNPNQNCFKLLQSVMKHICD